MIYFIGVALAAATAGLATRTGLEEGRAFYPTALTLLAAYYDLFSAIGG
jgi:hypothetical protein